MQALFIEAGHGKGPTGAGDVGAVGKETTERAEVVALARELIVQLEVLPLVVIPVGVEENRTLLSKIQFVNAECKKNGWGKDDALLLSLHLNSGGPTARGCEAWYATGDAAGRVLADTLVRSLTELSDLKLRNPSVKPSSQNRLGRLGILDDTTPTAALVECGFVTNKQDVAILQDRNAVAYGLYLGILSHLQFPLPVMTQYRDVPKSAWYYDDVQMCLKEGIFQMPSDGLFHPEAVPTRAELAAIVGRLLRR